jgi:proline iminopeptidase
MDVSEPAGAHTADIDRVDVGAALLYVRTIGTGPPVIVLHGGPDFDHTYLLPELDQLADICRLVYYDQRGRGRSADGVVASDVDIQSEIADLDMIREHIGAESVALLGHSWGGVLAMEYATRHSARISHLILVNTAPASAAEWTLLREHLAQRRPPGDLDAMAAIRATAAYAHGDPAAEVDYYRIHFRNAICAADGSELIVHRLREHFTAAGVLLARAIEDRLYQETTQDADWDLVPKLNALSVPSLVVHGDRDLVPVAMATHVADAIPGTRLTVLADCGHFAYLERPDEVHRVIREFLSA